MPNVRPMVLAFLVCMLAALSPTSSAAQTVDDYVPEDGIDDFALCRAAVFYHLDPTARGDSTLPVPIARTLERQLTFIMQESLNNRPPGSLAEGVVGIKFSERFFISFSNMLRNERERLLNVAERDKILMDCVPFVWALAEGHIDYLMAWRRQSVNAPPPIDPQMEFNRVDRLMEQLMQ
ncbi:MAG: hypothetical protein AAGE13_01380 [Pseudomonadota bacterium]